MRDTEALFRPSVVLRTESLIEGDVRALLSQLKGEATIFSFHAGIARCWESRMHISNLHSIAEPSAAFTGRKAGLKTTYRSSDVAQSPSHDKPLG